MKTERELFEEAFKKVNSGVSFWLNTWSDEDNDYGHLTASWGWHMWQASAQHGGYKLVPVEPTPKMIDATWDHDEEIFEMSSNTRNAFIYKAMIGVVDKPNLLSNAEQPPKHDIKW